ncbi:MAG TPA: hypothetical protein VGQ35_16800, partial [Dongiaceae bacterium]|nr:hypothetical protein [Dongiaceae bacterium]
MVILVGASLLVALGIFGFFSIEEVRLSLGVLGITSLASSMIPISLFKFLEMTRQERKIEDRPELILTFARSRLEIILIGIGMLLFGFSLYTPRFIGMDKPVAPGLMACMGALLLVLGILLPLYMLLRPRRLTLSPQGLDYSLFRQRPIPWHDIVSADRGEGLKVGSIYLHLVHDKTAGRAPLIIKCHHLGALQPVVLNAIKLRLKAF